MDSFNPTTKTQAALTAALQAASAAGNPEIRPAHLLLALLTQTDGIASPLLELSVSIQPPSAPKHSDSSTGCHQAAVRPRNLSSRVSHLRRSPPPSNSQQRWTTNTSRPST